MKWLALAAWAACGDNLAPPADAAPPAVDAAPLESCAARFAGNFAEHSSSPADCPTFDATGTLAFAIGAAAIDATFAIAIDLGASPPPGAYSSDTVPSWTATATEHIGDGGCEFQAGGSAVPMGSFTLTLAPELHGTLTMTLYVLTEPGTDCGDPDTETIGVQF